jgi:hypothetical protein
VQGIDAAALNEKLRSQRAVMEWKRPEKVVEGNAYRSRNGIQR